VHELLAAAGEERADAHLGFRSVTAIMGKALREHNSPLLSEGVGSLSEIWTVGDPKAMLPLTTPDFEASLWESVVVELYALGGLAVRLQRWAEVRELAAHQPEGSTRESWLRHGQVASSRATKYPEDTVLRLAARRLSELDPSLSPDSALESLCRFDLLSGLIISEADPRGFYPNGAEFSEAAVEPLIIDELRKPDTALRQHVFVGDQDGIREALRDYDSKARPQAAQARRIGRDWEWRAFADARTWTFIDEGHILEDWEKGNGWV
jgi:hypothetical protein